MDKRKQKIDIAIVATLTILLGAVSFLMFLSVKNRVSTSKNNQIEEKYDGYYVMITEDRESDFFRSVYEGAYEAGAQTGVYVELLGDHLSQEYSKEDLMQIAIASGVDGIILVADESEQTLDLINAAVDNDIQVVTLFSDCIQSKRCSYVGIGSYNLGREYGSRILPIAREKLQNMPQDEKSINVGVLLDANSQDSGQNIMFTGIQDAINKEAISEMITVTPVPVDSSNYFLIEGAVRKMFMGVDQKIPDIIVCPNELYTTSAYQAVVDYNKVGSVSILGYYASDSILKAIDREVIGATANIDTKQMGAFCIEALNDFREYGATSQYFTADITMIDKRNVNMYLNKEEENENQIP